MKLTRCPRVAGRGLPSINEGRVDVYVPELGAFENQVGTHLGRLVRDECHVSAAERQWYHLVYIRETVNRGDRSGVHCVAGHPRIYLGVGLMR